MINVVATITINEGKGSTFEQIFAEMRPGVLAEAGCLRYDLQRKRRSETDYVILEGWESAAALKAHGGTEAFAAFAKALGDLATGAPEITVLDPSGEQVAFA